MRQTASSACLLIAALVFLGACSKQEPVVDVQSKPARNVFVHLFEWSWPSIARECEEFLAPAGYTAVQVSPPQEHVTGPQWWTRYQPVSYKLESRSGTREQFVDMVERCAAVGVDIYVDAVINHMTGVTHHMTGLRSGTGVAGTEYGEYEYPPLYDYDDFNHCGRHDDDDIADFNDMWEVQNCELVDLADLKTGDPSVQAKIAVFLNDMLGVGVAGFRIDAAKHMPPDDISAILELLDSEAYVFQEVIAEIDGPVDREAYLNVAHVTEFQYPPPLQRAFLDVDLQGLESLGSEIGLLPSDGAVVFVDNHDTQRHGGDHAFNYTLGDRYVLANVFMLAWPYAYPKVMSGFAFTERDQGPPEVEPVADGDCRDEWVCEHRIAAIANMVGFRSATAGAPVTHWQVYDDSTLSFGRGDRGHVVINLAEEPVDIEVRTDLPSGDYCDVVSGGVACVDAVVQVTDGGTFRAQLEAMTALAILRSD